MHGELIQLGLTSAEAETFRALLAKMTRSEYYVDPDLYLDAASLEDLLYTLEYYGK